MPFWYSNTLIAAKASLFEALNLSGILYANLYVYANNSFRPILPSNLLKRGMKKAPGRNPGAFFV